MNEFTPADDRVHEQATNAPVSDHRHRRHHHHQHAPSAVAEENVQAVARIRARAAKRRTLAQRVSDRISAVAARESTVAAHVAWFALWGVLNARILPVRPFDPFPYPLLTTIVSLEAIFLSLFVLASQQRLTQEADHRADLDLQVDLLSEQEMTLVLQMLREVCDHHGLRKTTSSQKFRALAKNIDVGELAERVERNIGAHTDDDTLLHRQATDAVVSHPHHR